VDKTECSKILKHKIKNKSNGTDLRGG